MKVLIVEDETAAFENLANILHAIDPSIEIAGNTESVVETAEWLQRHPPVDLLLLDIHLSDGSAFALFNRTNVEAPVIFTTAYDQYAIDAFKVNSIDYLLKPIKAEDLQRALDKYRRLTAFDTAKYTALLRHLAPPPSYKDRILIAFRDKLLPVSLKTVAYFYTSNRQTTVCLKDGRQYAYNGTLEQIMATLDPSQFTRANKQFIIARDCIQEITIWFDNRLLVTLSPDTPEPVYISKNKAMEFKAWVVN